MSVVYVWCGFAAILLVTTALAHASTFLGIDRLVKWHSVMFLHLAIVPPFIAAIYCSSRSCGGSKHLGLAFDKAPRCLRHLTAGFFVYAFLNFFLFLYLNEGGSPRERDGKYLLINKRTVIRELTEAEYHQHQTYVVRGFSGHWMFFASGSLTLLVGAARLRHRAAATPTPPAPESESPVAGVG